MDNTEVMTPETTKAPEIPEKKPAKAKAKKDPFKEMIPIYLDKSMGGDMKYVYAGVNGHVYQVPVGMDIEVPKPIHEVLKRMKLSIRQLDGLRAEIAKENRENMKLIVG